MFNFKLLMILASLFGVIFSSIAFASSESDDSEPSVPKSSTRLSVCVEEILKEIKSFSDRVSKGKIDSRVFDDYPREREYLKAQSDSVDKDVRKRIRNFIDERSHDFIKHDFFSIDRFSADVTEQEDQELIKNWVIWHLCKCLVADFGGKNAKKELDLALESKIEFYENIVFMARDPGIGEIAKNFYRTELELVRKLPTSEVEE